MVHKICTVCGGSFRALGRSITCSLECSKQNTRDYNTRWRQARSGDNHSRKVDRELRTTQRAMARLEREEEWNREYQRRYRAENRERINERKRKWARANRDRTRKHLQRYRAKNPDKVKQWSRARRASGELPTSN